MTEFVFLRPFWLLLLLLVPVMVLLMRRRSSGTSHWHRVIPAALLAPLLPGGKSPGQSRRRLYLLPPILLVLAALALAGPSFRSAPSPLQQQDDSLVIVLDLSLSMLATDVEPNRLTHAIRKIRDLLALRDDAFTGLVVYAADGHVVAPLTDDRRTIEGMLSALDPVIMPAAGNRADLGVARGVELLEQGAPSRGRLLLITDGVSNRYAAAIQRQLAETPWQLDGLLVGTEDGGPIPLKDRGFIRDGDRVVITQASMKELRQTASRAGGSALEMTTSDTDLARLGLRPDSGEWHEARDERSQERRKDDGYWLLWLAVPLALFGWRRGALVMLTASLLWLPPQPAQARDWEDLWLTPEQRAPELIEEDPGKAARKLRTPEWRGTALYRDGQYEGAAEAFANGTSPDAWYNRGNALAQAGKPEAALEAWDQALEMEPEHSAARHNRELIEQYLEQQQEQEQQQQGSGDGEQGEGESGSSEQPSGESPPADDDSSSPGPAEGQSSPGNQPGQPPYPPEESPDATSGDATGDDSRESETAETEPAGEPATAGEASGEKGEPGETERADALSQSQEQWLRRIPDNPGGLLQRKFMQQSRSRNSQPDENDTPW